MLESQEPKYRVDESGRIVNRQSGEAIPDDEPVMIFRARDKNAAPMIAYYRKLCSNQQHKEIVGERLHHFVDFIHEHPDRMKEPDSETPND